jgi:hypothetical protein
VSEILLSELIVGLLAWEMEDRWQLTTNYNAGHAEVPAERLRVTAGLISTSTTITLATLKSAFLSDSLARDGTPEQGFVTELEARKANPRCQTASGHSPTLLTNLPWNLEAL